MTGRGAQGVIAGNDTLGATFLDGDGNPLEDLRLTVREGEQLTYQIKLDRRPARPAFIVWEPGDGDADLVPLGDQSWPFSTQGGTPPNLRNWQMAIPKARSTTGADAHRWQEAFMVTVEALQDNDVYPGERRFHHHLLTGDRGQERVELPDIVVVEIDDEATGPLRVFGAPEVISRPASGDTYALGERIEFQVVFTKPIWVTGSPYLEFDLGSPNASYRARANFAGGDGTQDLVFGYTVGPDDWDDDGIEVPAGSIRLNNGTIRDVETGQNAAVEYAASGIQSAHRVRGPSALSIADAQAAEATGATLDFAVTLSRTVSEPVTVEYATADGTGTAGQDYTATRGTLTFAAGQTRKTVSVTVLDDDHDEGTETLTLTLSRASGAHIVDDTATGTIKNEDPLQRAWLSRFGRAVAQHVFDGVQSRLTAPGRPGMQASLVGHDLGNPADATAEPDGADRLQTLSRWVGDGDVTRVQFESQVLTPRDPVARSAFTLSGLWRDGGASAVWGRGAYSDFSGNSDGLSVSGSVTTGTLGADYATARSIIGVALSHSEGEGEWYSADRAGGEVASSLTGLHPYLGYHVTEDLSLWGIAGYGRGTLTLSPQAGSPYRTDMDQIMAGAGARGDLPSGDGLSLAFEADVLVVRMTSDAVSGPWGRLAAGEADVSRLRLSIEASADWFLAGARTLAPTVRLALRHDGGDAETGFGVEVAGGLALVDPSRNLTAEVQVRGLVAHQVAGFRDWGMSGSLRFDPTPSSDIGPSLALAPAWGSSSSGGAAAFLGAAPQAGMAATGERAPGGRISAEAAYGMAFLDGQATGIPYLRMMFSETAREVGVGFRWGMLREERLTFGIAGTWRSSAVGESTPERTVMMRLALQ